MVKNYLKQTEELFGDELYLDPPESSRPINSNAKMELEDFEKKINECQKCSLGSIRNKFVFGAGDPNANLMLVGEAPGAEEDRLGEPFVGRAGKLLDKILAAIQRSRTKDVYICNVLKCRPPNNRDPLANEVVECEPYLLKQIEIMRPKLLVALGRVAGKTLLKVESPLKDMRNKLHDYFGTPLIVTYHPAALLRNPGLKHAAWEDFKWIRSILEN
jgi:DNA polymerase